MQHKGVAVVPDKGGSPFQMHTSGLSNREVGENAV